MTPRPLNPGELAALTALVEHADSAGLRAQLATARVIGTCVCGCSSVRLDTDAPPLDPAEMRRHSANGREDWFAIHASGDGADVVIHVAGGRLHELECYAGDGVAVPFPAGLQDFWIA
jgi:hypothetical protein